jgi:MFS family permease
MKSRPGTSRLGGRFWRVWTAQGISSVGDGVRAAALPLLAAGITHQPLAVASVTVAEGLPWVLFALVAGALVDRLDRRKVMGIADLCRFATVGLLAVAVATDHASIPLLCLAGFALGTAQTMFDNASQAILPAVVDKPQLERANSRLATIQILSESFVGPPLGAALFVGLAAVPFFVDSASFLIAALIVLTLTGSYRAPRVGPPRHLHTEIAEGLRWLWHHRLIRTLALMLTVWNMVASAIAAVFVLFALRTLHLSKVEYGVLLTSAAIGGLVGSFVATRVVARLGPGRALRCVVLVAAASYLGMSVSRQVVVIGVLTGVEGMAGVVWNVVTVSARQTIIPTELFGRVNSVYRFLGWGSIPIGAAIGGVLATAFGLRAPFVLAAIALTLMIVASARVVNQRSFNDAFAEAAARGTGNPDDRPDLTGQVAGTTMP